MQNYVYLGFSSDVVQISRDSTDTTVLPEDDLSYAIKTLFNHEDDTEGMCNGYKDM